MKMLTKTRPWGMVQWNYENHTFEEGEAVSVPRGYIVLKNCSNFPSGGMTAEKIFISECQGEVLTGLHCTYLGVKRCPNIKEIHNTSPISMVVLEECKNLALFSNNPPYNRQTLQVTNCRKFTGNISGAESIRLRGIARLPSKIVLSESAYVDIFNCGFQQPDVEITGGRSVLLYNTHCRSLKISTRDSIEIQKSVVVRDVHASARYVTLSSKQARSLSISGNTESISISGAKNLKTFSCEGNYRRLTIDESCSVVFPMSKRVANIMVERPHPDQKNYLFLGPKGDQYPCSLMKLSDNKVYLNSSTFDSPQLFKFNENYLPDSLTYKGRLRRKIDLWIKQPFDSG